MLLYKTKNDADDASMNHGLWTLKGKVTQFPSSVMHTLITSSVATSILNTTKKIVVTNVILVAAPANDTEST